MNPADISICFDRYASTLYALALATSRDTCDAEEAVVEAFCGLSREGLSRFPGETAAQQLCRLMREARARDDSRGQAERAADRHRDRPASFAEAQCRSHV